MKSLFSIASLAMMLTSAAVADISFPKAVDLCRAAVPGKTLIELEKRVRSGVLVFDGGMYNPADVSMEWNPRFRASDGAPMGVDVDTTNPSDLSEVQAIFAAISQVHIDFDAALAIAEASEPTGAVNKIELDFEEGILAYKVEFNDDSFRVYVDASSGVIVQQHHEGEDTEDLATPAQLIAGIDAAFASNGFPVLKVEGDDASGADNNAASVVEVTQWNAKSGMLVLTKVDAAGAIVSSTPFAPTSHQLEDVNAVLAILPSVNVTFADAITQVAADFPGAGIHEVKLESEEAQVYYGPQTPVYIVEIITATGLELDVSVNAIAAVPPHATAGTNFRIGDTNNDGFVNGFDLGALLGMWGGFNPAFDLDHDGAVSGGDLGLLLGNWAD